MGARVYLPTLGRFLQVDPIEGGTANAYVYALDPINSSDYSGQFAIALFLAPIAIVAVAAVYFSPAATQTRTAAATGMVSAFSTAMSNIRAGATSMARTPTKNNKTCTNCGVYKFIDSGAKDANNKGKVYIGRTIDFDRRMSQHGARVTPGTFEKIYAPKEGNTDIIKIREQLEINGYLISLGGSPFDVKSGLLANKRNGISPKNWVDNSIEAAEIP